MEKLKDVNINAKERVYSVQEGDTLRGIAKRFSTTERLIICDNFLKNPIKTGARLYIKSYEKIYIVTPCDTLEKLALNFGVSVQEILEINKILYIYAGERIVVP